MITRFKVEAEGNSNEDVREQLERLALAIMKRLRLSDFQQGGDDIQDVWECTADIISKVQASSTLRLGTEGPISVKGVAQYQGRMVFVWRGDS